MRKIYYGIIILLSIFMTFSPTVSAETTDDWKQYFFLPEDGRDLRLLWEDYLQYEDWDSEYGLAGTLAQYGSPQMNFSQAFVLWEFDDLGWEWSKRYLNFTEYYADNRNFDGFPAYMEERYVVLPAYSEEELKVGIKFWNIYPELDKRPVPSEPVGGFLALYELWGEYDASLVKEFFAGAEEAYNAVKAKGTEIKKIAVGSGWGEIPGGIDLDFVLMVTVEGACGGYVYDYINDRLYTFEEFSERLANDNWPTAEHTLMPEPTPLPTLTPMILHTPTPRPTGAASTATPSAGETAAPALTAAASLFPSSSSAPEQNTGGTVLIVMGAIFACVVLGAAVFFAVKNWRIKP